MIGFDLGGGELHLRSLSTREARLMRRASHFVLFSFFNKISWARFTAVAGT